MAEMPVTVQTSEPMIQPQREERRSLRSRAVGAGIWSLGSYASSQIIRLGSSMLLTRLLFPEAYGVMTIVWAYLAGLVMFSDVGLWAYLLQADRIHEARFRDAIWSINLSRSVFVLVAAIAFAFPMASFYGYPGLVWMLVTAAAGQFITNLGSLKPIVARRELRQKQLFGFDLLRQLVEVAATIVFTYWIRSPWALVLGGVVGALAYLFSSHLLFPGPMNRWHWDPAVVRELRGFSFWTYFSSIMTFCGGQADRLILAKLVPMDFLGLYGIAMTFAVLPLALTQQVSKLITPIVVQLRHSDDPKLQEKLQEMRALILKVGAVLVAGMCVVAPAFFGLLYDSRYQQAGYLAALLAIPIWFQVLESSVGGILLAFGDARSTAMCSAARMIGMLGGAFGGYALAGVHGFVVGTSGGRCAVYLTSIVLLRRHNIHIGFADMGILATAVLLAAFGWGANGVATIAFGLADAVGGVLGLATVTVVGGLFLREECAQAVVGLLSRIRRWRAGDVAVEEVARA